MVLFSHMGCILLFHSENGGPLKKETVAGMPARVTGRVDELTQNVHVYTTGPYDFTEHYQDEAERLIVVKTHGVGDKDAGMLFPAPDSEWREYSRELIWNEDADGRPDNYSLIEYRKGEPENQLSVIVSTYNQPAWLEKVLWGYEVQKFRDFELIIADDGSGRETYETVTRMKPQLSYPVKHVWHADDGFRKCTILNKAILASSADYLLFSDGDCVPRNDFAQTHAEGKEMGRFLSNGYYKLNMAMSELISKEAIISGNCFDIGWLRENGLPSTFRNNKFTATGVKRKLLNTFTPAKATWNGHGASGWRGDIVAANGFDERMEYGGEDRELGERLENAGIRGKQIRYSTVVLHLDHSRGYVSEEKIEKNRALRAHTRRSKITATPCGIYRGTAKKEQQD